MMFKVKGEGHHLNKRDIFTRKKIISLESLTKLGMVISSFQSVSHSFQVVSLQVAFLRVSARWVQFNVELLHSHKLMAHDL